MICKKKIAIIKLKKNEKVIDKLCVETKRGYSNNTIGFTKTSH